MPKYMQMTKYVFPKVFGLTQFLKTQLSPKGELGVLPC